MSRDVPSQVDGLVQRLLGLDTPDLRRAIDAAAEGGLPPIQVSATQGKLLHLLVKATGARTALEIGTLAGYSAIWLASALPLDGRLVTVEIDPVRADVAARNIEAAGLGGRVDVRVGPGVEVLDALIDEGAGPFGFVFIDADKPNNTAYLERSLRLVEPGAMVVVDNVVRSGAILDPVGAEAEGARNAIEWLASQPGVDATVIQTVGAKGHDGLAIAVVGDEG